MLCDVDIITPSGKLLAGIRKVGIQKACDQMMGWLEQGLSVNVRVEGNLFPLVPMEPTQEEKDAAEIISQVVLDIP